MLKPGDLVLVMKPEDPAEPPLWVGGMDDYAGNVYMVKQIHEDDYGEQYASLLDGREPVPFKFRVSWLTKVHKIEEGTPWAPGKFVLDGKPKDPETFDAIGIVGVVDLAIMEMMIDGIETESD